MIIVKCLLMEKKLKFKPNNKNVYIPTQFCLESTSEKIAYGN